MIFQPLRKWIARSAGADLAGADGAQELFDLVEHSVDQARRLAGGELALKFEHLIGTGRPNASVRVKSFGLTEHLRPREMKPTAGKTAGAC